MNEIRSQQIGERGKKDQIESLNCELKVTIKG